LQISLILAVGSGPIVAFERIARNGDTQRILLIRDPITEVKDADVMSTMVGNLSANVEMAVVVPERTGEFVGRLGTGDVVCP
jgi:hypothetical protein